MAEIAFGNNYSDLSDHEGFQFEFHCQSCQDAWRTEYSRYLTGTAGGFLRTASSLLGGLLSQAGDVADRIGDARYRQARDAAFEEAIEQAKVHFNKCRRCHGYFCSQCFNPNLNLCVSCAPSVEEEANVAAREAEIEMARTRAQSEVQAGRKTDEHVVCASCKARVRPSKFCSECGQPLVTARTCPGCGTELQESARFCPECGGKV